MRVLVVGAGGLGVPALIGLSEAGISELSVWDRDHVERSNLHRQLVYREKDVGERKVDCVSAFFEARFPRVRLDARFSAFEAETADELSGFDLVLDGTDRFETKLALSDACHERNILYVFGGVIGYEGQVLGTRPGESACLRCVFDDVPPAGAAPTCEELGIIGPIAGIVAARQVDVAKDLLLGRARGVDRLWTYDGRLQRAREIELRRAPDCKTCGSRKHEKNAFFRAPPVTDADASAPILDLRDRVCPATFVETKKALERLPPGGRLWVYLGGDESARNVPMSAEAAGFRVVTRLSDGRLHRILLEA